MFSLDCFIESLKFIVGLEDIPIGDKLTISKTIKRAKEIIDGSTNETKKINSKFGLNGSDPSFPLLSEHFENETFNCTDGKSLLMYGIC